MHAQNYYYAKLHELFPSVLNFNRISDRLKWLSLPPFYRRCDWDFFYARTLSSRNYFSPPFWVILNCSIRNVFTLTSLYTLSYVIMQFMERSRTVAFQTFESLNTDALKFLQEKILQTFDFYLLRWFTAGWEVITNIFLCDGKNSEVGIMLIDISFWLFVEWPPRSFRRFPCALCLSGIPWILCLQLLTM